MKNLIAALIVILLAATTVAVASPDPASTKDKDTKAHRADSEDRLYDRGTRAIDEQRWSDAIEAFRQITEHGRTNSDRALYWMAYAQFKSGRGTEALDSIAQLRRKFPSSKWIDDGKALELEVRQSSGQAMRPETIGDDDLKLIAITGLMGTDPERATTILEKMLHKPGSSDAKERALFVLAQTQSPRAQEVVEQAARGAYGAELQEDAIRSIATSGARNKPLLLDIYQKSTNADVKEAILQSFMIMGDHDRLLQVASSDPSSDMRSEAARMLGTMHATAELERLYTAEKSNEVKEDIIQALFIAGDVNKLASLARTEPNADLREAAIRGLGTLGSERTGDLLLQLWSSPGDPDTKEAIVEALFIQGNAHVLVMLARKEQNRDVKRDIVQKLSLMHSKEARDYMTELLQE